MVVKRNDLERFLNKLKNASKINEDNRIIKIIAEKGKELAEKNWGGRAIITSEISDNKCTISAFNIDGRKPIAYIEFGTGEVGRGTYEGNLPTENVPITGHWEYYYDSEHKVTLNGVKGWFWGKTFIKGDIADAPMWHTANELREYINSDLKNDLKSGV